MEENPDDVGVFTRREIVDLFEGLIEIGAISAALERFDHAGSAFGVSTSGLQRATDAFSKKVHQRLKRMLKGKFKPKESP